MTKRLTTTEKLSKKIMYMSEQCGKRLSKSSLLMILMSSMTETQREDMDAFITLSKREGSPITRIYSTVMHDVGGYKAAYQERGFHTFEPKTKGYGARQEALK